MKGIIIYKTKYGSTKKYVDWLAEETDFDIINVSKAKINDIKEYDVIALFGSVYASSISGLSFIRKNYNELKNKKIIVFAVGASPLDKNTLNELKNHNLKDDLKDISLFYGRGAIDEEKLSFKDRTMCKLLRKAISKQNPDTYDPLMKVIVGINGKCDWSDKDYLKPLIEYIK